MDYSQYKSKAATSEQRFCMRLSLLLSCVLAPLQADPRMSSMRSSVDASSASCSSKLPAHSQQVEVTRCPYSLICFQASNLYRYYWIQLSVPCADSRSGPAPGQALISISSCRAWRARRTRSLRSSISSSRATARGTACSPAGCSAS